MNKQKELESTLRRVGAIPYRRFGKVRVAFAKETDEKVLPALVNAVKVCTMKGPIDWPEPTMEEMLKWKRLAMKVQEVCDDPVPEGIEPANIDVKWILEQCRRYHFKLTLAEGKLLPVPDDGLKMDDIKKALPSWFMPMCNTRKQELIQELSQ